MRLFAAIEMPDATKIALTCAMDRMRGRLIGAKWAASENLHLTLRFFGEVPDAVVAALCDALGAIPPLGPMALEITRVILLPHHGRPRIVAAALTCADQRLAQLAAAIEAQAVALGFRAEGRPFNAHITLGRSRAGLPSAARDFNLPAIDLSFDADRFAILQSDLRGDGPHYTRIANVPL